eukprot:1159228-Pelagomonas_calceolata.AAC.11
MTKSSDGPEWGEDVAPETLADTDSKFVDVGGVRVSADRVKCPRGNSVEGEDVVPETLPDTDSKFVDVGGVRVSADRVKCPRGNSAEGEDAVPETQASVWPDQQAGACGRSGQSIHDGVAGEGTARSGVQRHVTLSGTGRRVA